MDDFDRRFPTAARIRVGADVTKMPLRDLTIVFPGDSKPVRQEKYESDPWGEDRIG